MRKRDELLSQGWGQIVTPPPSVETPGEKIAGDARKQLEVKSGKKVVSEENYLPESKKKKIKKKTDE